MAAVWDDFGEIYKNTGFAPGKRGCIRFRRIKKGRIAPSRKVSLFQSSSRSGAGAACRARVYFTKRSASSMVVRYAAMQSIAILFLPPRMIAKSASLM